MEDVFKEIIERLKGNYKHFCNSSVVLHAHNDAINEAIKIVREVEKEFKNNNGGI